MSKLSGEEEVALFNDVGADLHAVFHKNAYTDDFLDEDKFEITLKSLMFFTLKMVYDQGIPLQMMLTYTRGVYEDLTRLTEGRDARAETIADIAKQ